MPSESMELPDLSRLKEKTAKETTRMKFRTAVQVEVMKSLRYFPSDFDELTDEGLRLRTSNDVFMRWVSDGKAAEFAKLFQDLVPAGTDRDDKEIDAIAMAIAVQMGTEVSH